MRKMMSLSIVEAFATIDDLANSQSKARKKIFLL
jgi:hypothetical protein